MYRGNQHKSSLHYWFQFSDSREHQELFEKIYSMIDDKVKEILPLYLEDMKRQILENINNKIDFNINATLNGKQLNNKTITDEVINSILKDLY